MTDALVDPHAQALSHLEKADSYNKMGLSGQVQFELTEAERLDPFIISDPRFRSLRSGATKQIQEGAAMQTPRRIAAAFLFTDIVLGGVLLAAIASAGYSITAPQGFIFTVIINLIIGINLWIGKESWQKYTVWWAIFLAVVFGGIALISLNFFTLVTQLAFSGSLILLLKGTPSKGRVTAAVLIFILGYMAVSVGQVIFTLGA